MGPGHFQSHRTAENEVEEKGTTWGQLFSPLHLYLSQDAAGFLLIVAFSTFTC
jgi:hypothetical protein